MPATIKICLQANVLQDVTLPVLQDVLLFSGILIARVVLAAIVEVSAKVKNQDIFIIMSAILHIT